MIQLSAYSINLLNLMKTQVMGINFKTDEQVFNDEFLSHEKALFVISA